MENKKLESIFENIERVSYEEIKDKDVIILPPDSEKKINEFVEKLDNEKAKNVEITKDIENSLKTTTESLYYNSRRDIGYREGEKYDSLRHSIATEEKELKLRALTPKTKKTSIEALKLNLAVNLGIGAPVHVPLWHSGFWVTIKPLKRKEKIRLQLELSKEIDEVGKKTHALAFSNYSVIFHKVLLKFIKSKIIDTSIMLDENDDIFDYIKIQDINMLIWGLAKTMYPAGFDFVIKCKNNVANDENTTLPKCTFSAKTKLDLEKLLVVDESYLTDEHKKHMLKMKSKSMSKEEVLKYQDSLEVNSGKTITTHIGDLDIAINVKASNINKYLFRGEMFIKRLEDAVIELMKENLVEDTEDAMIKNKSEAKVVIANTMILNIYNHYIESISVSGTTHSEPEKIDEVLELLSESDEVKDEIKNKILDYIDKSLLAIIGMPSYQCPVCGEEQSELTNGFRSFIPIDVNTVFFTLLAYQYRNIMRKLEIE